MRLDVEKLKGVIELCDIPFEDRFLEMDSYRDKCDKLSLEFAGNACFEANLAFELGLLKDFEIKGIQPKGNFKMIQIAEYASGMSYDKIDAGHMNIIIVYKAFCDFGNIFIAVKTSVTFPTLHRYVLENEFNKILLPPYISSAYVWASDSFNEVMHTYPNAQDQFYFNDQVYQDLYERALFMLQLYDLDTESKRCLMRIDYTNFEISYTINLNDLRRCNYIGMYCMRPSQ